MDTIQKNILINRISLGYFIHKFNIDGKSVLLKIGSPTAEQKHISDILYIDAYKDAVKQGLYLEEELYDLLDDTKLWSVDNEVKLTELKDNLEKLKIGLFQMYFRSQHQLKIRESLEITKDAIIDLINKKHSLDIYSAEAIARFKKNSYLSACGIYKLDGECYLKPDDVWDTDSPLIDDIMHIRTYNLCDEVTLRELSRTEPWRSVWSVGKSHGQVFNCPIIDLSIEQQLLITWSSVYDNVYESLECPPDDVVEDDDMLDGWFLLQHKKRVIDRQKKLSEPDGESKAFQAQEVYLLADTPEDARKIYNLNTEHANLLIKQRMKALRDSGVIKEQDMPDQKRNLQMMMNQAYSQQMKSRK